MLGFGDRLANCYGKFTILFAPYCCYVTLHHYIMHYAQSTPRKLFPHGCSHSLAYFMY